jgi:signal transduction histidine kinase
MSHQNMFLKPSNKRPYLKGRIYSVLHKFLNDNNNTHLCVDTDNMKFKIIKNENDDHVEREHVEREHVEQEHIDNGYPRNRKKRLNNIENELISQRIIDNLENSDKIPKRIDFNLYLKCFVHELRTPLSTISYSLQILNDNYSESQKKETLQDVKESLDFIETILTKFSVIQNMNITLNPFEQFSIKQIINRIKSLLPHNSQYNNIDFDINAYGIHDYYLGDPYNLNHVIINLIKNAIKYQDMSHKNKISIRVLPHFDDSSDLIDEKMQKINIIISDTNPHILPHIKNRLFESFNSTSGSGLGLYISKSIIELHNGIIYHEYIQPIGNRFTITIPLEIYE